MSGDHAEKIKGQGNPRNPKRAHKIINNSTHIQMESLPSISQLNLTDEAEEKEQKKKKSARKLRLDGLRITDKDKECDGEVLANQIPQEGKETESEPEGK